MKITLLVISFLFFYTNIFCQNSSSREQYLEIRKTIEKNPESAFVEITEFQKNAKTKNSIALSSILYGQYYFAIGDIDVADSCFKKAYTIFEEDNDTKGLIIANTALGVIAYVKGDFSKAIEVYLVSIEFMKAEGDTLNVANLHNNIAAVFLQLKNYDKSEFYYRLALQGYKDVNDSNGIGLTLRKLGSIYFNQYKFEEADVFFNQAMDVFKLSDDSVGIANTLLKLGDIQFEWKHDLKSAALLYQEAEQILIALNITCDALFATEAIGDCYYEIGEYDKARKQFIKVLELTEKCEYNYKLPKVLMRLSEVEKKLGHYKKALEYQTHSHSLNDSIFQSKSANQVEDLEIKYQSLEKDKTILQNELDLTVKNEKLTQQSFWMWIIGTSSVSLALIVILFFYYNRKQAKLNTELKNINQFKSQILTIIGHDLRSPIAQIVTSKENVEQKANSALEILDNLLVWGSMNKVEPQKQENTVSFELVLDELEEEMSDLLQTKDLKLNIDLAQNDSFSMNKNELEVILRNILSNAIKYSPKNSEILIRNKNTCFTVENKYDSDIQSGSQIGLTIVKTLCTENGFKFSFEKGEKAIAKIELN